jgi:hypothetical protein
MLPSGSGKPKKVLASWRRTRQARSPRRRGRAIPGGGHGILDDPAEGPNERPRFAADLRDLQAAQLVTALACQGLPETTPHETSRPRTTHLPAALVTCMIVQGRAGVATACERPQHRWHARALRADAEVLQVFAWKDWGRPPLCADAEVGAKLHHLNIP